MTTSYKKIAQLLAEHETISMQIRAHRLIALRKQQRLCNSSIIAFSGKKLFADQVDYISKQLDKFNDLMTNIEKEISKVFYIKTDLDALLDDAECQEEEISTALIELSLSDD